MRVKLKTIMAGDHGVCQPGQCCDVPDHVGEELIRSRQAEAAPPPAPAKRESADEEDEDDGDLDGDETASNPPTGETATTGRRPRPRRTPQARNAR